MIPRRFILVAATFLLSVLLYVDRACIASAKDPVMRDLGLGPEGWGWVLASFAFGYALFQTPSGLLADRYGPRRILATVVTAWSLFTGLTAAAGNLGALLVVRFLFGAGEAGAFPGVARAVYSWIPKTERGMVQGVNFSGSRLGAAFAMPLVAWMIHQVGWKTTFVVLMAVGFVWAVAWFLWFRDEPEQHPQMSAAELQHIVATRQKPPPGQESPALLSAGALFGSRNMWLAMGQYFASNFTFFFCLSWLYPHVKDTYQLGEVQAGFYAMAPLLFGAVGNVLAGGLVDRLFRAGHWTLSRRLPAMVGFGLAAVGLVASVHQATAFGAVAWLSLAILGADMTLSPSWSFCIDIGGRHAGAVSGTMNMAGNLGAAITTLAFPYLQKWTASFTAFFYVGAALNLLAIGLWSLARPERKLEDY